MTSEPGLDRYDWEGEFQTLAPELEDSPRDALPELRNLVKRMLAERGYDLADSVVREGEDREVVAEFTAADEVATLVARGEDVDPGDVAAAIQGLRDLYEYVIEARRAP